MKDEEPSNTGELAHNVGSFLRSLRQARRLTLREVEQASEVSNAYLSQMEHGKIAQPSPHILRKLAIFYGVPTEDLMVKAGYIDQSLRRSSLAPASAGGRRSIPVRTLIKRGAPPSNALGDLTPAEQDELLKYLAFLRTRNT